MNKFSYKYIEIDDTSSKEYRKKLLKSIEDSNAYIGGEYIIAILNDSYKLSYMSDLRLTIYIKYSNLLSFIISNIKNVINIKLNFENIVTGTFLYIKFYYTNLLYHIIYVVPDDIDIIEYIKSKAIVTTSEIWLYDNKIEGTNLELSLENKGYLKEKYLNLLDNLDENIIKTINFYTKNNFEIIIDTSKYIKTEITYDNKEKNLILIFLISFFNYDDMLEYFFTKINKKKYPEIEIFKKNNKVNLFYKIHFILFILNKNNKYDLDNIKSIFKVLSKDNYIELIKIIYHLIVKEHSNNTRKDIAIKLKEFKEIFKKSIILDSIKLRK